MKRVVLLSLLIIAVSAGSLICQEISGPNPSGPPELAQFAFLVGTWQTDYISHLPEQPEQRYPVVWTISWILEGNALQDSWTVSSPHGQHLLTGTMFRSWNNEEKKWEFVEQTSVRPMFHHMWGEKVGETMVMYEEITMPNYGKVQARRVFSNITADTFRWQMDIKPENSDTWITNIASMEATRIRQ